MNISRIPIGLGIFALTLFSVGLGTWMQIDEGIDDAVLPNSPEASLLTTSRSEPIEPSLQRPVLRLNLATKLSSREAIASSEVSKWPLKSDLNSRGAQRQTAALGTHPYSASDYPHLASLNPRATGHELGSDGAANVMDVASRMAPRLNRFSPNRAVTAASSEKSPLIVELAPGVREPAVLLEHEGFTSSQQVESSGEIARAFEQEIGKTAADPTVAPEILDHVWREAQRTADARYRLLFGDVAFNQATAQAAREALAEQ